ATALEETQLKEAQAEIDQHSAAWSNDDHVSTLAKYFKLPASSIRNLSAKNQGWGAVTIELAMAWDLNTMHSQDFPFMTASLNRVEALRADGHSWGDISRTVHIALGPVIQEAQVSAKALAKDDLALTHENQESVKVEENR